MRKFAAALICISLSVALTGCAWRKRAQARRESAYEAERQSYSEVLKLGMNRKQVEDFLRTKDVHFSQLCCIDERGAFADLLKIGKEHHPWYCEAHNVYVALQFAPAEPQKSLTVRDSDILRRITVFHWLEGCL